MIIEAAIKAIVSNVGNQIINGEVAMVIFLSELIFEDFSSGNHQRNQKITKINGPGQQKTPAFSGRGYNICQICSY